MASLGGLAVTAVAGQTFRSGVDAVTVDVLVTRDGQPVTGLTADDFIVLDNDVPQQIDLVMLDEVPITLLLVLDTSGSVGDAPLTQLLAAVGVTSEALRSDDRVGLVTFSDKLRTIVEPPAPRSGLPEALGAGQSRRGHGALRRHICSTDVARAERRTVSHDCLQ